MESSPEADARAPKPTYACGQCGKTYSRLEYVRRHERKHQDSKPFPCPECSKSFARSDVLLRHRRRCHPGSVDGPAGSSSSGAASFTTIPAPSSANTKATRKASAAPYSIPSASLFVPPSPQPSSAPSPSGRSVGLHSAPTGEGLAPYSISDPPGGYPLMNVWGGHPYLGSSSAGEGASEADNLSHQRVRSTPSYVGFHLDPSLSDAGGTSHNKSQPSWVPTDQSPHGSSSDSPLTSTSRSVPTPPAPTLASTNPSALSSSNPPALSNPEPSSTAPSQQPLPSPFPFLPSFSPGGFFSSTGAPIFLSPAPTPLGNPAASPSTLPFSPGQFLSQFNFGTDNSPGGIASPGAKAHPEAGFLFDGLLSPNSLLPLPLPSPSARLGMGLTGVPSANIQPLADDSGREGRDQLAEMEREEQRLIEGGAWLVPERKMLHSEGGLRLQRSQGDSYLLSPTDPFYIDPAKFGGCYAVEHWQLPPLHILSKVAKRTIKQVIPHLPFLHIPTFALNNVPGCVGFAIASCGRPLRNRPEPARMGPNGQSVSVDESEPSAPGAWDGLKSVVRTEKTDMLVRSFTRSKGVLFTEYNVGLLQALLLYNAPNFLSDAHEQRMHAHMQLGTIIAIARQVGIFDADNEHVKIAPTFDWQEHGVEAEWKKWCKAESARRTAWIIYVLDTVASLETGCPRLISSIELADFPLPAPDTIWLAPEAVSWAQAVSDNPTFGKTLSTGLNYMFIQPGLEEPACLREAKWQSGAFFWLCLILAMVREVVELGEGRRRSMAGDQLRWAWWAKDDDMPAELASALERWRRGWDFDTLTAPILPTSEDCEEDCVASVEAAGGLDLSASPDTFSTSTMGTSSTGSTTSPETASWDQSSSSPSTAASPKFANPPYADVYFCREALPYFWFSKMLLGLLDSSLPGQSQGFQPGVNQFRKKGVSYSQVLQSARTFSRAGEGLV